MWGSNSWQIEINGYKSIEQTNDSETDTIYKDHWFPTAEIPWQPIHKQSWVCVCQRKFRNSKKGLTQAGLEPTISCSVGRRLIHWATEPSISAPRPKSTYSKTDHYRLYASETVKMNAEEKNTRPKQKLSFSDLFFIEFIENNLWISCYLNPGFSYFTRTCFIIFGIIRTKS